MFSEISWTNLKKSQIESFDCLNYLSYNEIMNKKGKIIDKTQEYYSKGPEGAEYLVYEGEDVPEGVLIFKSNVGITGKGILRVSPFGSFWGWSKGNSFHVNFKTPQEAIDNYLNLIK